MTFLSGITIGRKRTTTMKAADGSTEFPSSSSSGSVSVSPVPGSASKPGTRGSLTTADSSTSRKREQGETVSVAASSKPGTRGGVATAGASKREVARAQESARRLESSASTRKKMPSCLHRPLLKGALLNLREVQTM